MSNPIIRSTRPAGRIVYSSELQATVVLNATAGDKSLPSVVLPTNPVPNGTTIHRVTAAISFRKIVESSGSANATVAAQDIQVRSDAPGTYIDAIDFPDNSFPVAASATEGGMMVAGDQDLTSEVDGADTYEFQWDEADCDAASLTFHDWQCHLIVEYR